MTDRLRFSPDILVRLGEELVPHVDQGIVELVKNAYDADATTCIVEFEGAGAAGGRLSVKDNGRGMTAERIRGGWLVVGRSGKTEKDLTPVFHRVPVGDKGLGRLAALRLGKSVSVVTRSAEKPGVEYSLVLDWEAFAKAKVVEDVPIEILERSTSKEPGTEILVEGLKSQISRGTMVKLARNLLLLADPFLSEMQSLETGSAKGVTSRDPGFRVSLQAPEFEDLQARVARAYFSDAEYRIQVQVDEDGKAEFRLLDWMGNLQLETVAPRIYSTLPFRFDLWVFILDSQSFSTRASTLKEVKDWLTHFGGVHIYEDDVRVPPYGGAGDDWLDMNLRRARSPEMRPSTNTSIGRVRLSHGERRLLQKTDRVGYVETDLFIELRKCCQDALDWAARTQIKERDRKRQAEKAAAHEKTERASVRLDAVLSKVVRPTERKKVDQAIQQLVKDAGRETRALRDELQLYRSLATAGMASAVFSHEIGRPLTLIDAGVKALQRMIPEERAADADRRGQQIATAHKRLDSFVSLPLRLLSKRKRRSGRVSVNVSVSALAKLIAPILDHFGTELELKTTNGYTDIHGSEALIDGICINLIMNSLRAFQRPNHEQTKRQIVVTTASDGANAYITVSDNGGGIEGIELEDIWLPGVTTDPDGTGFGLTIVRDSVKDLGGTVRAVPLTESGGAEFIVSIPLLRSLVE